MNKKPRFRKYIVLSILLMTGFFTAWTAWGMYTLARTMPGPGRISDRSIAQSTKIYDRTGETLLYEVHGEEKRTVVPLDQIPMNVRNATIAAEDIHFYSHSGIDLRGIARAVVVNLSTMSISQGGSTITQQLVKKALLSDERTWTRKFKEAILALLIERRYSKDEILELYLNQIPYGSNSYGVESASQAFFGKDINELTLAQSAIIAALPNAPTYYSPYGSHNKELMERKEWILDRMADAQFISKEEAEAAKREELAFIKPKGGRALHFVMYIREYLNEKFGEDYVEAGGLKVITTLDAKLQEDAETAVTEGADKNAKLVNAKNAALIAIDPKTGDVLAMVGSRNYSDLENDGNVNVTLRPRQPGSAFKPFVYATAFKKGYVPDTVLFDTFTEFNVKCNANGSPGPNVSNPRECYHPQDYDLRLRGPVSLRQALAQSLNIPAVKLLYLAGIKDSITTAQDMGISTIKNPSRYGLSLVLGGGEVTLFEMTSAFGVFGQEGIRHPARSILRIENARGEVLEEAKDAQYQVLDTEVARAINDILSDNDARVPVFSPTSSLNFPGRKVAVKTGTTQDYHDAWTIGYSSSIAAGVWVGNNDNTSMSKNSLSVMIAAPIWRQFMERALAARPADQFTPPALPTPEKPVLRGLYRTGSVVKIDLISRKLATPVTPPELVEEVSFGDIRSILASVRKEDPLGPPPSDPFNDPQYPNWQAGIDAWLSINPLPDSAIPTEYDDTHTPEKKPNITIVFPNTDSIPADTLKEIRAEIQPQFPLQEIQLFINDELRYSQTAPINPGLFTFVLDKEPQPGPLTIRIVVYDTARNRGEAIKMVNILEAGSDMNPADTNSDPDNLDKLLQEILDRRKRKRSPAPEASPTPPIM